MTRRLRAGCGAALAASIRLSRARSGLDQRVGPLTLPAQVGGRLVPHRPFLGDDVSDRGLPRQAAGVRGEHAVGCCASVSSFRCGRACARHEQPVASDRPPRHRPPARFRFAHLSCPARGTRSTAAISRTRSSRRNTRRRLPASSGVSFYRHPRARSRRAPSRSCRATGIGCRLNFSCSPMNHARHSGNYRAGEGNGDRARYSGPSCRCVGAKLCR